MLVEKSNLSLLSGAGGILESSINKKMLLPPPLAGRSTVHTNRLTKKEDGMPAILPLLQEAKQSRLTPAVSHRKQKKYILGREIIRTCRTAQRYLHAGLLREIPVPVCSQRKYPKGGKIP